MSVAALLKSRNAAAIYCYCSSYDDDDYYSYCSNCFFYVGEEVCSLKLWLSSCVYTHDFFPAPLLIPASSPGLVLSSLRVFGFLALLLHTVLGHMVPAVKALSPVRFYLAFTTCLKIPPTLVLRRPFFDSCACGVWEFAGYVYLEWSISAVCRESLSCEGFAFPMEGWACVREGEGRGRWGWMEGGIIVLLAVVLHLEL